LYTFYVSNITPYICHCTFFMYGKRREIHHIDQLPMLSQIFDWSDGIWLDSLNMNINLTMCLAISIYTWFKPRILGNKSMSWTCWIKISFMDCTSAKPLQTDINQRLYWMHTSYTVNQIKSNTLNSSYFNLIPNTKRV